MCPCVSVRIFMYMLIRVYIYAYTKNPPPLTPPPHTQTLSCLAWGALPTWKLNMKVSGSRSFYCSRERSHKDTQTACILCVFFCVFYFYFCLFIFFVFAVVQRCYFSRTRLDCGGSFVLCYYRFYPHYFFYIVIIFPSLLFVCLFISKSEKEEPFSRGCDVIDHPYARLSLLLRSFTLCNWICNWFLSTSP